MAKKVVIRSKEDMLEDLQENFQEAWFDDADYFYQKPTSAIMTGKSALIGGQPVFSTESPNPDGYVHDVKVELDNFLHENGWEALPYDGDTLMIVPQQK